MATIVTGWYHPAAADEFDELLRLQDQLTALRNARKFSEAARVGREMVERADRSLQQKPTVIADCIDQLVSVYDQAESLAEAEPYCLRAIEIREKALGKQHESLTYPLMVLASIHRQQRDFVEAERYYRRGIAICDRLATARQPVPDSYLPMLVNLAAILNDQNRYAEAEPLMRKALAIAQRRAGAQSEAVATILNNLAHLCGDQGRMAEAEAFYQQSLAIKERLYGKEHPEVATALCNLGLIYSRQQKYAEAKPLLERALAISEQALGQAPAAQAVEFGASSPAQIFFASLEHLGNLHTEQREFAQAEPYYRRALEFQEKLFGHDNPVLAQTLSNLALLYEYQQQFAQAEPLLDRALNLALRGGGNDRLQMNILLSRGMLYWFTDRRQQGLADLDRALELAEGMRAGFSGDELQRGQAAAFQFERAFELMTGCQRDLGNVAEAFATAERRRARTLTEQINLQGVDLLAGLPESEAQALRQRDDAARARCLDLEKQFAELANRQGLSDAERERELAQLTSALEAAQQEAVEAYRAIRTVSPAYRLMISRDFRPVELATIHHWVQEQRALLLEYYIGVEHSFLFVVPHDGEPQVVSLPEINAELAEKMGTTPGPFNEARLRQMLSLDGHTLAELFKQPGAQTGQLAQVIEIGNFVLWNLLVPEEFRQGILAGHYERLMVVPDAALANLPFDALVVEQSAGGGQGAKYLLDVGPPIITGPSATLLYNLAQRQTVGTTPRDGNAVLSVGDPAYRSRAQGTSDGQGDVSRRATLRGELKPLPYSGWETDWVAQVFDPVDLRTLQLKKGEATEQAVRQNIPGRQVVHLACHGLADQSQGNLFGALAFATPLKAATDPAEDGFLTLAEIYALDARSCELAILSACETHLGPQQQGEGVFALSRGFLVAGARRVVATNWVVDDESSASLVSMFCSILARQHKSGEARDYASALQQAKQRIRQQTKWQHPYHWASFTLVGPH